MANRKMTFAERLEKYSIPEPNSGCLLWTGAVDHSGHGVASYGENGRKYTTSAHRMAYTAHRGPIPEGMCVCHKCDVPSCVNPDHLWIGTNDENMADMVRKGRSPRTLGEAHPLAKLTDDAVRDIRSMTSTGVALARKYNVSTASVSFIRSRKTWTHVVEA